MSTNVLPQIIVIRTSNKWALMERGTQAILAGLRIVGDRLFASKGSRSTAVADNSYMERLEGSARLIIVCGLPGSGKTTLARTLESELHAIRFCPDEWMEALSLDIYDEEKRGKVEALQWKLAQRLLTLGLVVIIEWGTWGRSERDALRVGARALGAAVELHYLPESEDVLFERIQQRNRENPPIDRAELTRWIEIFQAPGAEEMAFFDEPLIRNAGRLKNR